MIVKKCRYYLWASLSFIFKIGGYMFSELRIQVPYPCQGKCVWCSTFKKNARFMELYKNGISDTLMDFYLKVIRDEKPRFLMLSGGEPILYPKITGFLEEAAKHVDRIYLYTSFQYAQSSLDHLDTSRLPAEKLVFTHSVFDFLPEKWEEGIGFPHDQYVDNIRLAKEWPGRKMIKFIMNHEHMEQEVDLFKKLVEPGDDFSLEGKILNNQSNDYGKKEISKTRDIVHKNSTLLKTSVKNTVQLENINQGKIIENCIYWKEPELRFALYRENPDIVLKYRFCGYFPPDFTYKIHINQYKPGMFGKAFEKGRFKKACKKCRLKFYENN